MSRIIRSIFGSGRYACCRRRFGVLIIGRRLQRPGMRQFPFTSDQFYWAGHTEDLRTAVAYMRHNDLSQGEDDGDWVFVGREHDDGVPWSRRRGQEDMRRCGSWP